MAKWIIIETYYKHADYEITIVSSENELMEYLLDKLEEYDIRNQENVSLDQLIEQVVELGNDRVKYERGWGVREIRPIQHY